MQQLVIIKLKFEKAFDTVDHSIIFNMMQALGFDTKWRFWINEILCSGSSAILLNGVLGKFFHCKRRVRQGDPLSPLLFVLASDLLQCIVNGARARGLLTLPISVPHTSDFRIIQYADDTIIIMKASQMELLCLRSLLNCFSETSGMIFGRALPRLFLFAKDKNTSIAKFLQLQTPNRNVDTPLSTQAFDELQLL